MSTPTLLAWIDEQIDLIRASSELFGEITDPMEKDYFNVLHILRNALDGATYRSTEQDDLLRNIANTGAKRQQERTLLNAENFYKERIQT